MKDLWFARSSHGYGGKGTKATGFEHHRVTEYGGALSIESEVSFKNFGVHRYRVSVDPNRTLFEYGDEWTVELVAGTAGWQARIRFREESWDVPIPVDASLALPSLAGRFLPLTLPQETGELATYAPVPEDAFPWWMRPDGQSWFPLVSGWTPQLPKDVVTAPRTIVWRGEEQLKVGRSTMLAFCFDHVGADGTVLATTWLSEEGSFARYEQQGTVLTALTEEQARALEPAE